MSPKHQQRLALEQLDLSGVLDRLQAKDGFDIRRAEKTVTMYKRFLKMVQENRNDIMVPNEDVDTAWHHHILDTVQYAQDCQKLFGQFLHHNPHFYGTDAFFEACDKTQATFEKTFTGETFLAANSNGSFKPAVCGGMLKDDIDLNLKPAVCGGMLKGDTDLNLKPAVCGGMLKDDGELNLKPAVCGGMLKGDTDLNLKPAACSGEFKSGASLPPLAPDAVFQQYQDDRIH
jgi:hypothetical protein